jgi:hypothetical protein
MRNVIFGWGASLFLNIVAICWCVPVSATNCDPTPSGIVAWWAGNGNTDDNIGTNNGILEAGAGYAQGEVGQAFSLNGSSSYVFVPASSSLNAGVGGDLTIEGWIRTPVTNATQVIVEWQNTAIRAWGVHLATSAGPSGDLSYGTLYANVIDTGGNWHQFWSSPGVLVANQFQHVALTYDKTSGLGTLYVDGSVVAQSNLGVFTPQTSYDFYLGARLGIIAGPELYYSGSLDEFSIYNRALAPNEIAAIYQAGGDGKCTTPTPPVISTQPTSQSVTVGGTAVFSVSAVGTSPLTYQWSFDGASIANATNATLSLIDVQSGQAGNYAVQVSNRYGSTNSTVATLTLNLAPQCDPVPAGIVAWWPGNTGANDIIGEANGTLLGGASIAPGLVDDAFDLPPGGYVSVPDNPALDPTNAISVEAWIYTRGQLSSYDPIIKKSGIGTDSAATGFALEFDGPNVVGFWVYIDGEGWQGTVGGFVASNQWTHVVGTYDGTALRIYENGVQVNSGSLNGPILQSTNALNIGRDPSETNRLFNGLIDEPSVYNRALASNEIAAIYQAGSAGKCTTPAPPCAAVPAGIVSWWPGDGNALDIVGSNNGILEGGLGFAAGEVDQAFDFNAAGEDVRIPASPSLNVGAGSGFTLEAWINCSDVTALNPIFEWNVGDDQTQWGVHFYVGAGGPGSLYANVVDTSGIWHSFSSAPGIVMSNVFQHAALTFDEASGLGTIYLDGAPVAQANLGSYTPQTSYPLYLGARRGPDAYYTFAGLIDEPSVYNRALASNEIAAIYQAGSAGKCNTPTPPRISAQPINQTVVAGGTAVFAVAVSGTAPLAYQWTWNGTNLAGATNATLTLTGVQLSEAGTYAVRVSNPLGATNSAGAVLTVVAPPFISQQPQSQSIFSFGSATFTVAVGGTGPFTYQWKLNGTNLVDDGNLIGSTTTNLTIGSVTLADAGGYQVLITSPYGSTNSSIAVLSVPEAVISLGSTGALSGTTITVPVIINALGIESAFAGSVAYDPTKLTLQSVLGATPNYYQTNNGYVGFAAFPPSSHSTFAPGSNVLATLVFDTLPVTNDTEVALTFGNTPVTRQLADSQLENLPAIYQDGSVQLTPAEYEADVYPRFGGDHQVTLADWLEEGRLVAGLDVLTNSDEFRRADCAPRNAPDGALTIADWVQAGRYALGLDPLTLVGAPGTPEVVAKATPKDSSASGRILQVATVSAKRGQTVNVPVSLVCVTNENGVGLTISFNAKQLRLLSFAPGSALPGGSQLNVNSNQVGRVGLALAASPGSTFAAGTNQLGVLTFAANASASGTAAITLDDSVVKLQTADLFAASLATTYVHGAVVLPSQPNLAATVTGGRLQFNWSLDAGTFQVQTASQPLGPWTTLVLPLTNNGVTVTCVLSSTNQQQYYRLLGQ